MASSSPNKMQSPVSPRKSKIETLEECTFSTAEDLDTKITSCLYYMGKNENKQATASLEIIRRLLKSIHWRYSFLINEINLDLIGLKQNKNDGLQKREKYIIEKNAELAHIKDNFIHNAHITCLLETGCYQQKTILNFQPLTVCVVIEITETPQST